MADNLWSDDELRASVVAYLSILAKEMKGEAVNKTAIKQTLLSGPLSSRKSLDFRFGNISAVLDDMGRSWIDGFTPRRNVGANSGARIRSLIESYDEINSPASPRMSPPTVDAKRILPPTGYWLFVCKRDLWDGEAWLSSGGAELVYYVSKHNVKEVQDGDLGLLRMDSIKKSSTSLGVPAGIYAIVEVVERPRTWSADEAPEIPRAAVHSGSRLGARLRLLASLAEQPVTSLLVPAAKSTRFIDRPERTASMPISADAFQAVVSAAGEQAFDLNARRIAVTPEGIRTLESEAQNRSPLIRHRMSRIIERGPEGDRVKAKRGYECQICRALGLPSIGFKKRTGGHYVEAHHVMPVSTMTAGSLAENNIMVLCPTHHRQAHYGQLDIIKLTPSSWTAIVDGTTIDIPRILAP